MPKFRLKSAPIEAIQATDEALAPLDMALCGAVDL